MNPLFTCFEGLEDILSYDLSQKFHKHFNSKVYYDNCDHRMAFRNNEEFCFKDFEVSNQSFLDIEFDVETKDESEQYKHSLDPNSMTSAMERK